MAICLLNVPEHDLHCCNSLTIACTENLQCTTIPQSIKLLLINFIETDESTQLLSALKFQVNKASSNYLSVNNKYPRAKRADKYLSEIALQSTYYYLCSFNCITVSDVLYQFVEIQNYCLRTNTTAQSTAAFLSIRILRRNQNAIIRTNTNFYITFRKTVQ